MITQKLFFNDFDLKADMRIETESSTSAASKMEFFLAIVNTFQALSVIINSSILDMTAVSDPPPSGYISEDDSVCKNFT